MLCVNDVMQVICYVLMMLCMLCKLYAMCLWCYASYASVHNASCYDKHWSTMTPWLCKFGVWLYASSHMTCYASLVFEDMQVTCASLHLSMICIHMQVNPFVCHTYICKFTPLYDINNLCKLISLWHMWFMQVWVDYLC